MTQSAVLLPQVRSLDKTALASGGARTHRGQTTPLWRAGAAYS